RKNAKSLPGKRRKLDGPRPRRNANGLPREQEVPGSADDDPTIADRYKRRGARVAEKRSEDRSNTDAGKRFQVGRRFQEFQGPLPSPVCAPCNHRAAQDSRLALSLGIWRSFRPDRSQIVAAPKADRLDSEST